MSRQSELAQLGRVFDTGPLSNRNLIINGAMQVAQRGSGPFTNASGGYQTVDRFQLSGTMGGSFTLEQASDAPSGSGFDKSFKALVPTGFPSPTSTASSKIITSVEAQDLQHLMYGSSDAVTLTLSFWVKATVTGTYIFELYGDDTNRTISEAYTISTSNTWEKKTITIEGDVSGTINNDNGSGLSLVWWLGAGSNFTSGTLQTTWGAYTAANRAVGQVNAVASNNDAFYITGVQLEVGDTATPFEHRSYGDELQRCERYYQVYGNAGYAPIAVGMNTSTTLSRCGFTYRTRMRATPTIAGYNNLITTDRATINGPVTSISINGASDTSAIFDVGASAGGLTQYRVAMLTANITGSTPYFHLEAEL